MKTFGFFNIRQQITIDFDENKSVAELVAAVCKKYPLLMPKDLGTVTVYDPSHYHVVTDLSASVKDENLSGGLCFAYFVKNEFLYVEGSWGHHMIDMDAVKKIKKPFMFRLSLTQPIMHEYFVATKSYTVKKLYESLVENGYKKPCKHASVYEVIMHSASCKLIKQVDATSDESLFELLSCNPCSVLVFE